MTYLTTDLCDANEDTVRVVEPMFSSFGGRDSFHGKIATLKLFEDNTLVRKTLESPGADESWSSTVGAASDVPWSEINWPHWP
jgi:regulator of RNase E activity RraA